jgi:hypothetical protein
MVEVGAESLDDSGADVFGEFEDTAVEIVG